MQVTYISAGWQLALELSDGQALLARVPLGYPASRNLTSGKTIIVYWSPESVAVLSSEAE